MTKTRIQSLMLPVLSLAAILLFTTACGKSASENPVSANTETKAAQVAAVTSVRVSTQEVSASVQATGSFAAQESSNVAPDSPGVIAATPVDVGSVVQAGQVIARLDDRDAKLRLQQALANQAQAEASVRQAQSKIGLGATQSFDPNTVPEVLSARASSESAAAQARLAEADAQRYANLINSGDVSRTAYDRAKTAAETAQAQANAARQQYEAALNTARQNFQGVATQEASLQSYQAQVSLARKVLSDIDIKAPFAGYVSARPIAAGEYVATSATIATILRITPIKLMLQVPQLYAPNVKLGLNVEANVSGFADKIFKGRITAINPAVETNSRTFIVEATFPNTDIALKPGMFATSRIVLPGSTKGLFVPRNAVLTDATTNSSQVFMIVEGKARVAVVQIGEVLGDKIRILSGIPDDAVLAQDHLTDLYDGQSVTVN
ncbi:MAG: efflux RND transporter periplasmic adaptor subunit [Bryobacteraceae bacterium]